MSESARSGGCAGVEAWASEGGNYFGPRTGPSVGGRDEHARMDRASLQRRERARACIITCQHPDAPDRPPKPPVHASRPFPPAALDEASIATHRTPRLNTRAHPHPRAAPPR